MKRWDDEYDDDRRPNNLYDDEDPDPHYRCETCGTRDPEYHAWGCPDDSWEEEDDQWDTDDDEPEEEIK